MTRRSNRGHDGRRPVVAAVLVACSLSISNGAAGGDATMLLPVPAITIYPGDRIGDTLVVEMPFSAASPWIRNMAGERDMVIGRVAKRTLPKGSPIPIDALRSEYLVIRGNPVTLVYEQGPLNMTANAVALSSGGKGDAVSVRNSETGRVVEGIVKGDRVVTVGDQ